MEREKRERKKEGKKRKRRASTHKHERVERLWHFMDLEQERRDTYLAHASGGWGPNNSNPFATVTQDPPETDSRCKWWCTARWRIQVVLGHKGIKGEAWVRSKLSVEVNGKIDLFENLRGGLCIFTSEWITTGSWDGRCDSVTKIDAFSLYR